MKKILLALVAVFSIINYSSAQDDLMKVLDENQSTKSEKVIATFKTLKLINTQTNETVHKRVLDFRIAHRFGNIAGKNGGVHSWYGMDNASDIRVAFEYGISERLAIGLSRSKYNENVEGLIKYRLMEQTKDNKRPIAITLFANSSYTPQKDLLKEFQRTNDNGSVRKVPARRLKYATQVILARQFSSRFSALITPTYVHRNYIGNPNDANDLFAVGAGVRLKVTRSMCIIADYFYTFNDYRHNTASPKFYDPFGFGVEFETGGHVFSLMFTNSPAIIETEFLETHDNWADGEIKFSFNISRNFSL